MYQLPVAALQGEDSGLGQSFSKPTGDCVRRTRANRRVCSAIYRLMLEESTYLGNTPLHSTSGFDLLRSVKLFVTFSAPCAWLLLTLWEGNQVGDRLQLQQGGCLGIGREDA